MLDKRWFLPSTCPENADELFCKKESKLKDSKERNYLQILLAFPPIIS
jgi:hypothetical protein